MTLWEFHRHRIFNFTVRENAMQKTISESFNRMLNARTLDKIDTDANYTHWRIVGRFCETPEVGV